MHVFLLGVSHQTAPIDVRERLDFSSRDVGAAVEALAARYSAGEAVVLSTCNRSEIYVAIDDPVQARPLSPDDPNLRAMSLDDPKIFFAVLTWAVYSFGLFARTRLGWTGRRAAWLSTVGFLIVLLNFLPIGYFVTTSHTFQ